MLDNKKTRFISNSEELGYNLWKKAIGACAPSRAYQNAMSENITW